jgi:hypothetical protein
MAWSDLIIIEENSLSDTGFFHFQVRDSLLTTSGYGTDSNKKVALAKACHEYAERKAFKIYNSETNLDKIGITSNGFACHYSHENACLSAENELFERDILIAHWIEKVKPLWLSDQELIKQTNSKTHLLTTKLKQQGFNFRVGILAFVNNRAVSIGTITLQNGEIGHAVATACANTLSESIVKIFADLVRVADLILGRKKQCLPLYHNIAELDLQKPQDHLEYYLNPTSWMGLDWFFESSDDIRSYNTQPTIFYPQLTCSDLNWHHTVIRAVNNSLQGLFFGPTLISKINGDRISTIQNSKPHPLA